MIELIKAVAAALAPLYFVLIPGVALPRSTRGIIATTAHICVSSLVINILLLLISAVAQIPLATTLALVTSATVIALLIQHQKFTLAGLWQGLATAIVFFLLYTVCSLPFLLVHDGLPTGDSQKAIIWANLMQQQNRLPNYQQAITWLNRDPTDFFTPGLHALVAGLTVLSPHPLLSVGFLAIILSLATAWVGGSIAWQLNQPKSRVLFTLTVLLVLTNFRFLRYLREPGYHLQNILGELLLFGLLWLMLRLYENFRWKELLFTVLTTITLIVSHQFTTFLAPFLLLPLGLLMLKKYPRLVAATTLLGLLGLLVLWLTGLITKLPHVITSTPHLLSLTPTLTDYPTLLSFSCLLLGFIGWFYLLQQHTGPAVGFTSGALLLFMLSQAPQLGLDIPPVRALFYSIVPLSIGAAFSFYALAKKLATKPWLRITVLSGLFLSMTIPSVTQALNLSHTVRTNSTLLPEQLSLIDAIQQQHHSTDQAVLIDDYNRRSASWLALSGQAMFTRLAADIVTQQNEAQQSALRRSLYLNQLDFEKIFSLGSRPEIAVLLDKHSIRWVTGIDKSSATAFAHNPVLRPSATGGDITLFEHTSRKSIVNTWLLKPSTLANDIGDEEDEFKHLPLSLRVPNLSEPQANGQQTFRTTTAPFIPLTADVGDYVAVLWDQDKDNYPDSAIQLLVQFVQDPGPLSLTTSTGQHFILKNNQPLTLPPRAVPLIKGALTLIIENPNQRRLAFDLVALGQAPTP